MNFGMIILNHSIRTMQNYATWIQIVLLFILKLNMFMKILLRMLKKDFIHQIMIHLIHQVGGPLPTGKNKN